jgi:hypothetical protein
MAALPFNESATARLQVAVRAECIGSFLSDSGVWMPRVWDKPNYNFDGFGKVRLEFMNVKGVECLVHIKQQS